MDYTQAFLNLCNELPPYCMNFFSAKNDTLGIRTRFAYAGDLKVFFVYLLSLPMCDDCSDISEIPLSIIDNLTMDDIVAFMMHLTQYEIDGRVYKNSAAGKRRKLASLRAFVNFFRKIGKLHSNPLEHIDTPSMKDKEILILSPAEQSTLRSVVWDGKGKTPHQLSYHKKTMYRDRAILSMFLGTGLRVSELVSINIDDVDIVQQRILVIRKGGKRQYIYFNHDVLDTLCDYLDFERNTLMQYDDEVLEQERLPDGPLFVSLKHCRISVRMVEKIIKNYASFALSTNVKVTPHSLRRTYGSMLYKQYQDLALVQHALGHSSPETTKKHYVQYTDEYNSRMRDFDLPWENV